MGLWRALGFRETPFARPPGGHRVFARFWPEMTALVCCLVFFAVMFLRAPRWGDAITCGAGVTYAVAALALLFIPVALASMTWSTESARGTMESLLLTPVSRYKIAWLRFWGLAFPVLRMYLYVLPVYICVSGGELSNNMQDFDDWPLQLAAIFSPKFLMIAMAIDDCDGWHALAVIAMLLKAVNDLGITLFAVGVGYYVSSRIRSVGGAIALSYGIVIAALWTLMAADAWAAILIGITAGAEELAFGVGGAIGFVLSLLRYMLCPVLVHLVAAKFDRYALGRQARA